MTEKQFFPVIGLEVHVELTTKRKMFCGCPANHFDKEPNSQTCPVCLGLPGALPVPNKEALRRTILLALALKCQINKKTWFDRKNYFYPDLPKGYQISQFFHPLGVNGQVSLKEKTINIKEVHLEEDTAKSLIRGSKRLLDFNKSGVPLIEIVSCPDLKSAEEAKSYAQKIHQIVRTLKISPANMEKGQMRLEANISLKKNPQDPLPNYKVEVKNINSFRYLYNAINYEIKRQEKLLLNNQKIVQETRGYNAKKKTTYSQRTKEESYEYRYFPEPDIPPLNLSKLFNLKNLKASLPKLPEEIVSALVKQYQLSRYQANILVKKYPKRGEKTLALAKENNLKASDVANAIINKDYPLKKITPQGFINKMKSAQKVETITGDKLKKIINLVVKENSRAVKDYQSGKKAAFGFLIGQVQQKTKGQADIAKTKQILKKILN
ncbi:MAG: Asp-tRNA(Asn)/Glu-tRNA(Gln) amidotransferase subunit GatB [Patescibacteria group bacterium]|jgi:aspartyl-tRNA(Asn)/glutamyl-tRNA(Gln) amidotransferase subunit B